MQNNEEIIKEWIKEQYDGHYVYVGYQDGDDLDYVNIDGCVNLKSLTDKLDQLWTDKIKRAMPRCYEGEFRDHEDCVRDDCIEEFKNNLLEEGIDLNN